MVRFETETDTEVIAHLVTHYMKQGSGPEEAAHKAFDRLRGAYAVVLMFAGLPNTLIGARQGTPLAVGYGDGEMFIASNSYALAPLTRKISFLEDGDRLVITNDNIRIMDSKKKYGTSNSYDRSIWRDDWQRRIPSLHAQGDL